MAWAGVCTSWRSVSSSVLTTCHTSDRAGSLWLGSSSRIATWGLQVLSHGRPISSLPTSSFESFFRRFASWASSGRMTTRSDATFATTEGVRDCHCHVTASLSGRGEWRKWKKEDTASFFCRRNFFIELSLQLSDISTGDDSDSLARRVIRVRTIPGSPGLRDYPIDSMMSRNAYATRCLASLPRSDWGKWTNGGCGFFLSSAVLIRGAAMISSRPGAGGQRTFA